MKRGVGVTDSHRLLMIAWFLPLATAVPIVSLYLLWLMTRKTNPPRGLLVDPPSPSVSGN